MTQNPTMIPVPVEVSNFFLAMQAGETAKGAIAACFAEDAVYVEPFTGETRTHRGKPAIMKAMALGWELPMLDTRIEIRSAATQAGRVFVDWTCHSPSLPGGKGSGRNRFTIEDGLITELVTTLGEGGDEHRS